MTETAYRSAHPDVLVAIADHATAMATWEAKAAALLIELGFEGRSLVFWHAIGSRRIVGVSHDQSESAPIGWRISDKGGLLHLRPNKATKTGKAAMARIDETRPPAELGTRLPGMPGDHLTANSLYRPMFRHIDGVAWVRWGCNIPERPAGETGRYAAVDLGIWDRTRLSAYYAAIESQGQRMPDVRNVDAGDDRRLLIDATRRIIADQHTSPKRVQRTLRVGFAKAHRLLDLAQDAGVIGPPGVDSKRPVLVGRDQSEAVLAVLSQELTADA